MLALGCLVTGAIIPWFVSKLISFLSLSLCAKEAVRGVVMQKGWVFSVREMWNFSPGMVQICPSKSDGNSDMMASADSAGNSSRFSGCTCIDVVQFG